MNAYAKPRRVGLPPPQRPTALGIRVGHISERDSNDRNRPAGRPARNHPRKDWDELREALSELDPPDIAEILIDLPPEEEGVIFRVLPRERARTCSPTCRWTTRKSCFARLTNEQMRPSSAG